MDLLRTQKVVLQQLPNCPLHMQISTVNVGAGYKTDYTVQTKIAALMPNQQLIIIATSTPELLIYRTYSKSFL